MRLSSLSFLFKTVLPFCTLLYSCSSRGPGIFARRTPHEQYSQHIIDAGLRETALGRQWFEAAGQSLAAPLTVTIPYKETGYFAADRPHAVGLQFAVRRGEKIHIGLEKNPAAGFSVYLDVWEAAENAAGKPRLLASADTTGAPLDYDVKADGTYLLRIQPELLKSGEYTLTIQTGPSLAYPLPRAAKTNIGSFWGVGRDGGARKHEGIDIFAPFRTPALAAADGVVSRVTENNLGGKVVFFRPYDKDYTLYYAHLDQQLVHDGQQVRAGDTLGLVGNTGNARFTPSHLHFGIYTMGGAIDPLPFVRPVAVSTPVINAPLGNLGKAVRATAKAGRLYTGTDTKNASSLQLALNTLLLVEAATGSLYKVTLPGGERGFVSHTAVQAASSPLQRARLKTAMPLRDAPDTLAPRKKMLPAGEPVAILATYRDFYFTADAANEKGWIRKQDVQ